MPHMNEAVEGSWKPMRCGLRLANKLISRWVTDSGWTFPDMEYMEAFLQVWWHNLPAYNLKYPKCAP